jgi:hypothetical protein
MNGEAFQSGIRKPDETFILIWIFAIAWIGYDDSGVGWIRTSISI